MLITVWTGTILAGPFLVKYAIDQGIVKHDAGVLNRAVVAYVLVAIAAYVVYRLQIMLVGRIGEGFLRDLRIRVFDHLQHLSMPFYDREKAGVIVSRMTSDVDALAELVQMGLLMFLGNALLLVFSVVVLALVSWQLLLVCLVTLPFVILSSIKFQRDSNKAYLLVRDRIGTTLSSLQEGLSGVRVIQAYGREDEQVGGSRPPAATCTRRTWTRCASRPGTCRSSSSPACSRPRSPSASAAGSCTPRPSPSARSRSSC